MAMPETPMHEDYETTAWENDVWFAGQIAAV